MRHGIYLGILLLALLALAATAGAETGEYTVALNRTYGGPDAGESAYAIVPDPGGSGFLLAGETGSFGAGKSDAWVVGLDAEGGEVWNRTYGGEGADTARSIVRVDNESALVAGNLTFATNGTRFDTDAWLMTIGPSGGEVWNRTYGGPDVNASANAVTPTGDGGFLFVGSTAAWGGNESDAWVVRVNETGSEVWSRLLGGAGNDTANAVVRLPDGDFVLAGSTESSGAGMADAWVVRLNGSGGEVWNRTFGSPDDDAGRTVINTPDGGLLVAGTFTERPNGTTVDTDALLIKLTPSGDIIWNWIYGDFGVNESAAAVLMTADRGYVFAGETGFPGVEDTDAWVVGIDASGAVTWSTTLGGGNPGDRAASLIEAAPGEYLVAGTFNATAGTGPVNTDAWVFRLAKAPEPTPVPTAAPIKPPKAPGVPQKPAETPGPVTTPAGEVTIPVTPAPTRAIKPVVVVTVPAAPTIPAPTATPAATPAPTLSPTAEPTMTATPQQTELPTRTPAPTETPGDDDDNGDDDSGDDNGDDNGSHDNDDDGDDNDDNGRDDDDARNALSGMVWYDLNADGIPDDGEPGVPGISVRLIGERTMLDAAVTGADGSYRFADVSMAGYTGAEFLLPDGYSCTVPGRGSDAAPLDGVTVFAGSVAGQQTLNAGIVGEYRAGTPAAAYGWVLGTTWSDDNRDGRRDETYGMTDVEVRLLDADGEVLASARTGYHDRYTSMYLFGPLPPGEYAVAFTPPDGYTFTAPGEDSHADPATGTADLFAVGGGETVTRGAGLIPSPTPAPGEDGPDGGGAGNTTAGAPPAPAVTLLLENGAPG